jgi:hypothetical protein
VRSRARLAPAAAALIAAAFVSAQPAAPGADAAIGREEVREAIDELRNDPNLARERTVRMLRFKQREAQPGDPWWLDFANALARWTRGLTAWLAESGRIIVWVIGAISAAVLVAYVVRILRGGGSARVPPLRAAPSHVRDLDIRPESLPDDIGAEARALLRSGEQRVALALLYRGLLSRLVHVHGVPIRASSTEGECLALARRSAAGASAEYAARLVGVWTAAVYGATQARESAVEALCTEFGPALDRRGGAAP